MDDLKIKQEEPRFRIFNKIKLSDPLVLAAFPIMAYLLIFAFYSGYFSVFNLPVQFISFDLSNIFIGTGILLGLAFLIYYFGDLIFQGLKIFPKPIRTRLERFSVTVFAFLVFWYLYNNSKFDDWRDWGLLTLGIIISGLLEFGSPWLLLTNKKAYLESLEAIDKKKDETREKQVKGQDWETPIDKLIRLVPEIFLFVLILGIAYTGGRYDAYQQTNFQIINTTPERVVLWSTNDYAICAPFDRQTNTIEPSYIVLKIGDDPQIEYQFEKIGNLRLRTSAIPSKKAPVSPPTLTMTPMPTTTLTPTTTPIIPSVTPVVLPTPTQRILQPTPSLISP